MAKLCNPGAHKNIVAVFRHGKLPPSYYFLDMEFCDMNLDTFIERKWSPETAKELPQLTAKVSPRMRTAQIWDIMEDITSGLAFVHSKKEIHRDLKPRNSTSRM